MKPSPGQPHPRFPGTRPLPRGVRHPSGVLAEVGQHGSGLSSSPLDFLPAHPELVACGVPLPWLGTHASCPVAERGGHHHEALAHPGGGSRGTHSHTPRDPMGSRLPRTPTSSAAARSQCAWTSSLLITVRRAARAQRFSAPRFLLFMRHQLQALSCRPLSDSFANLQSDVRS